MENKKPDLTTREQALRVARMLGCQGAHEGEKGWMPCASMDEYEAIKKGKEEYLKVRAAKNKKPTLKMVQRTKRLETKTDAYYESRSDALSISKIRGCGGVRTIILAGKRYYAPCDHKPRKGWEKLDERPIAGIETLPGGGLVSAAVAGKEADEIIEEKGFVNFVSRSTDPDTFSDPESARIRARNLGCIGIRRYTARDGKLVWMPCTNVSDYNRVTGIRGDNSPRNNPRRQGSGFKKKALGTPIGASSSGGQQITDGDGDGYVASIPGGPDDTPVRKRNQNPAIRGQIEKGNIDLNNRPVVRNSDGSISTVRSISITEGRVTVLIPTVIRDKKGRGKVVSDRDAIRHYQRSGEHLGKFSSSGDADRYAEQLHNQQAAQYSGKSLGMPIGAKPSGENVDGDGDGFTTGGIVGGEDKIPVAPKITKKKFKNPTQVGIARALNDANHRKAGYRGGTMVRGYGSATAGWRSRKLENGDFEIEHTVPMGVYRDVDLIGLSDDQRKANFEKATRMLQTTLEKYAKTLKDKGYEVEITTSTNKKGELSGFVVVKNQEKKSLNQSAKKMGVGLVLFKGVPKARKKPPTVTSTDINNLAIRVRQHNAKAKTAQKTNLRDLKTVYLRGLNDGDRSSANKRVSQFLSLLLSDKPKDVKYSDDNDLLPLDHPWRNKKTNKKWAGFDDGEYGIKYKEQCCPQIVKRHYAK